MLAGSKTQQPAFAHQQTAISQLHPSSQLVQLWDVCVSSTSATEASAAAAIRLAASCSLMSQSNLGAVLPLLESIVAQAQAPAQLRETAFAGLDRAVLPSSFRCLLGASAVNVTLCSLSSVTLCKLHLCWQLTAPPPLLAVHSTSTCLSKL